ncbi:aspartyl-phosphate phosphatase Spo0E family protein [Cytobacillus massiliigabonensis]|uniref:aspartyl-phosphate phosphatase Spo0E family protein n=1 Tax=Cytobacillus massiliigabonensis TaxID=1871011 RepID=UPI000C833849|nr:aspartyl-phosphate phosphatase Spo0E family protein [Cytobacillus massiliigabonensis]
MTMIDNNYILLKMINKLREEMIKIGLSEGLNSKNTIKISQMLDIYISKYQKINSTK